MRKYGTYCQYCQLGFSLEIEVPQLGLARNLHSSARAGIFWLISNYDYSKIMLAQLPQSAYFMICGVSSISDRPTDLSLLKEFSRNVNF